MSIINEINELAISTRLLRLSEAIRKDVTRIYKEHGIEFESKWFPVLYVMIQKSPLSVIELAEEIGYAHPSVIALVREMERNKLIRSVASKTDGRKRMLLLTTKALAMKDALQALWDNLQKIARDIADNTHNLMKAMEQTEAALEKESFYERYQQLESRQTRVSKMKKQ